MKRRDPSEIPRRQQCSLRLLCFGGCEITRQSFCGIFKIPDDDVATVACVIKYGGSIALGKLFGSAFHWLGKGNFLSGELLAQWLSNLEVIDSRFSVYQRHSPCCLVFFDFVLKN